MIIIIRFCLRRKGENVKPRKPVFLSALIIFPLPLCLGIWKRKQTCQSDLLITRNKYEFLEENVKELAKYYSPVTKKDFYIAHTMYKIGY